MGGQDGPSCCTSLGLGEGVARSFSSCCVPQWVFCSPCLGNIAPLGEATMRSYALPPQHTNPLGAPRLLAPSRCGRGRHTARHRSLRGPHYPNAVIVEDKGGAASNRTISGPHCQSRLLGWAFLGPLPGSLCPLLGS